MFTYHQIRLTKEQKFLDKPVGRLVQVDGKNMNVYVTGQGEQTLVFLAGGGTTSPILDFKSLYSKLEKEAMASVMTAKEIAETLTRYLPRRGRLYKRLKSQARILW